MDDDEDVKALRTTLVGVLETVPAFVSGTFLTTEPKLLPKSLQDEFSKYCTDVAAIIESLTALLRKCPPSALKAVLAQDMTKQANRFDSVALKPQSLNPGILIEEIDADSDREEREDEQEITVTERLLLLVATINGLLWIKSAFVYTGAMDFPQGNEHTIFPHNDNLDEKYRPAKTSANELYEVLNSTAATQSVGSAGGIAKSCLPGIINVLEKTICAYDRYSKLSTKSNRLETYSGPEGWERALVSAQFAWFVSQALSANSGLCALFQDAEAMSDNVYLWQLIEPLIIAALLDPSPHVQTPALWTVYRLASVDKLGIILNSKKQEIQEKHLFDRYKEALLRLTPLVKQAVIASDETVYPASLAAASALIASDVLRSSCEEEDKISLFEALLEEGERKAYETSQVEIWLLFVPRLVFHHVSDAKKTRLLMYFRRLMPLLLQWSSNRQSKLVRAGALRAIQTALQNIPPQRAAAHVTLLWSVLDMVSTDEVELSGRESEDVMQAAVSLGAFLLNLPGGQKFKDKLLLGSITPSKELVDDHKHSSSPNHQITKGRNRLVNMILKHLDN